VGFSSSSEASSSSLLAAEASEPVSSYLERVSDVKEMVILVSRDYENARG
jgi:hypothetical protein